MVIKMFPCKNAVISYTVKPYDTLWHIAQRYNTDINSIAALNPGIDLNYISIGQVIYICPGMSNSMGYLEPSLQNSKLQLRDILRMLWEQHITWTRFTIISMINTLPDVNLVTERLLRNVTDFEAALNPFYGPETAHAFGELLKDHLVIAAQLVSAAKSGNTRAAADAEKKWYKNADDIASFLASINPYWLAENWKAMLYNHLSLTKTEAAAILTGNYAEGIRIFDEIEKQALQMADIMATGIIRQFYK